MIEKNNNLKPTITPTFIIKDKESVEKFKKQKSTKIIWR